MFLLKPYVQLQVMLMTCKTRSKKGQSLTEYALILALIAVFCIVSLRALGGEVNRVLQQLTTSIQGVSGS